MIWVAWSVEMVLSEVGVHMGPIHDVEDKY